MISYKPFFITIKNKGLSQYQIINEFGISSSLINRMRQGKSITTSTLDKLCSLFNCDICDILEYIDDK